MATIGFTLNGKPYELNADKVVAAMRNQVPGRIQVHAVEVDGVYFPVKQVLAQSLQISKGEFISTRAVELLRKVGLRVIDTDLEPLIEPPPLVSVSDRSSSQDGIRKSALELAIAHSARADEPVEIAVVLNIAEQFESWLTGAAR